MKKIFNIKNKQEKGTELFGDEEFILKEINNFKASSKRAEMLTGKRYYIGKHDILNRERTAIGKNGKLVKIENLPNNHIVDNQYKKMIDQKVNYILGKPLTFQCENNKYIKLFKEILNKKFMRLIKNVCEDSLNCGIGFIYFYYNEIGEFSFKRFDPCEVIPFWHDKEHTILDCFIRFYETITYIADKETITENVEIYDDTGVSYYVLEDKKLTPVSPFHLSYFTINNMAYNFTKIPLVPIKYNMKELPLINFTKSIQDAINIILSNFQNNLEEDTRNTIIVLINYDGENLGDFRQNLATYGAVKVCSNGDSNGDVKTLQIDVNAENYKAILQILKKAIIENSMGYDAKDDRVGGNANQMNILSMYSDIDLDANNMETEMQASFEEIIYFINCHLFNTNNGDFFNENIEVIFNRDMLMNETEIIDNVIKSMSVLSKETAISQHPWINDVMAELRKIKKQEELNADYDNFGVSIEKNKDN